MGSGHSTRPDAVASLLEPGRTTRRGRAGLTGLRHVTLNDTKITDVGLVHLAPLVGLEELWLDNTAISDAGMERCGSGLHHQ